MAEPISIPNISDYIQEIIDDTLILIPKKKLITEEEMKRTSLTKSKIIECYVTDENNLLHNKYKTISNYFNKYMDSYTYPKNITKYYI